MVRKINYGINCILYCYTKFIVVHIITAADVRSVSGSLANLDQPISSSPPPSVPSCSSVYEPIIIAPITTPNYDISKCCIAPVMITSAPPIQKQYQGMFTSIKQEPASSCNETSPPLSTIGTMREIRPLNQSSTPLLQSSSGI